MRRLTAFLIFMVLLLAACRSEPERSAMGQPPADDGAATRAVRSGSLDVELRRLWSGSDFNFFASQPSPDGRWVTEIDWDTGDLAVRDLTTGRLHRVTDKGPWAASGDYAEVARFSPDGRRIAYSWFEDQAATYEVRLLDFTVDEAGMPHGSAPRVVHAGIGQYAFWIYGWTDDDELLVGLYRPDNSTALGFLSLSDGDVRVLKSFDWSDARAALSPDGRFIAYDHAAGPDPFERDIHLLSADGSIEMPLVEGPGADRVLGWIPADGSLLFYSDGSGAPSIWRLPMRDGAPSGEAELVRADMRNVEPLGFAGETFYFGIQVEVPRHHTATIDFVGRRLVDTRPKFDAPYGSGWMLNAIEWSPDGKRVAQEVRMSSERTVILQRRADGEIIHQWPLELRLLSSMIRWAPDGNSLFISAQDVRGRAGFFEIDLDSGEVDLLQHHGPESGRAFSISPDGERLYFTRVAEAAGAAHRWLVEIVARELETGMERVIHRVPDQGRNLGGAHWSPLALTPDGSSLAYPEIDVDEGTRIRLLPLDGGPDRLLHHLARPGRLVEIVGWEPDGNHLLILVTARVQGVESSSDDESQAWSVADVELHRIAREDGSAERIGEIADYVHGARLHPDGRTLVYRAGRPRGEIWALEGLGSPTVTTDSKTGGAR